MITERLDELTPDRLAALYPRAAGIRASFVTSLDGAVAIEGRSAGLSSGADRQIFRLLRMTADAVLVGAGTLRDEDYRPITLDAERRAWRAEAGLSAYPRLVVVSAGLALDPRQRALAQAPVRPLIVTCARVDPAAHPLSEVADIIPAGTPTGELDTEATVAALGAAGLRAVLCEGGPRLFGTLSTAGVIDELCLTVTPLLAGPGADRITAGQPGDPHWLRLAHALIAADGSLLLRYTR